MFEGLAAWVLNNYLGRYVENLNTDQLSIGLLKGEVELECLPLKKEAFHFLDLPVQVIAGYIGKIRLKIPMTRIKSEPWVISIEQLYVVISPVSNTEYDEEQEREKNLRRKIDKLDLMEADWRSGHEAKQEASYYASSYTSWVSYGASFVSNIVENLQLKVRDVHIRFEDPFTNPSSPLACGIIIESLVAQSANENWQPQFVQKDGSDATRKLVELQNLSVYWDISNVNLVGSLDFQELVDAMQELLFNKMDSLKTPHDFFLEPICAKTRLQRNCDNIPLKSRSTPRISCEIFVDSFILSLNELQYGSIVHWAYEFSRFAKAQPFLKWRPQMSVLGHVKEWWIFTIQPTLEEIRNRKRTRNWAFLLKRASDNVLYVKAYTEHLINPIACPSDLRDHKSLMEQEVDFKELKILREIAMDRVLAIEFAEKNKSIEVKNRNAGLLQRWFPLWKGWYSSADSTAEPDATSTLVSDDLESSRIFEEEILDVLNNSVEETECLYSRDYVFARIKFSLKSGMFNISNSIPSESLVNLELTSVSFGVEMRPKARSTMFDLSLGALFLRDATNTGSLFQYIAAPQRQKEIMKVETPSSRASFLAIKKVFPWVMANADPASTSAEPEEPLFHLIYEIKPLRSNADYKLHIQLRSLDLVYNSTVFHRVREFFATPHRLASPASSTSKQRSRLGEELAAVANKVKQQTKEELQKNWDRILRGQKSLSKRWDVSLNISTPQIIIPENLLSEDTTLVIFSFGRLQFSTVSRPSTFKMEVTSPTSCSVNEDEEVFRTPFSTPPGEEDPSFNSPSTMPASPPTSMIAVEDLTETSLLSRMYDRYFLQLSDLQILVTKAKTNWKYAYLQGTSTSHVVNRFSIGVQLERRVVHTNDPKWPRAKLSGELSSLVMHIDELKIEALKKCWAIVTSSSFESVSSQPAGFDLLNFDLDVDDSDQITNDALLLVMEFQIGYMSLDVQSLGRSLAELQVSSIKSSLNKRLQDTSICFMVQSLLLVDALQTFGPDFELLVASHRNICLDSVSGSMRDSEPTSPCSPASPNSQSCGGASTNIHAAIKQLERNQMKRNGALSPLLWPIQSSDVDALIVIEYTAVKTDSETTRLVNVQFNNLDIIANQETISELSDFFKRYSPTLTPVKQPVWDTKSLHIKLSFDFHRLSVLLVQLVHPSDFTNANAKKVATVTLSDASIQASFEDITEVRGSLGGVHIVDLAQDRSKYSKIISVGRDLSDKRQLCLIEQLQADLYSSTYSSTSNPDVEAFYFIFTNGEKMSTFQIRMASVKCIYSSLFWNDLSACVSEIHKYVVEIVNHLRSAATEAAIDYLSNRNGDMFVTSAHSNQAAPCSNHIRLDLTIDSPVLIIPESMQSEHVLEAHLGKIKVKNSRVADDHDESCERVVVDICDMNLYSKQYESDSHSNGCSIIHNAALEFRVDVYNDRVPIHIDVLGSFVTSLKVTLTKHQYGQLLRTISLVNAGFKSSNAPNQVSSPLRVNDTDWCVKALFQLPNFSVELVDEMIDENSLVNISFNHFVVDYKQCPGEAAVIDISLDSVSMEDLSTTADSKHRFLMISSSPTHEKRIGIGRRKYLSSSCPDIRQPQIFLKSPQSLPDKLNTEDVFQNMKRLKEKMMYGGNIHFKHTSVRSIDQCPCTPPPSPLPSSPYRSSQRSDALVHVKIRLMDLMQDDKLITEKIIDVNFNCLDMVIKQQPWKVIVNFFNGDQQLLQKLTHKGRKNVGPEIYAAEKNRSCTKTNVFVRRLSVLLVKEDVDLANFIIMNVKTNVVNHFDGDLEVDGILGRVSLIDLTVEARLYKERFTTLGNEALIFRFFKYGFNAARVKKDFDATLDLEMSAVSYVHTNRFYLTLVSFIKELAQFQDADLDEAEQSGSLRCLLKVKIQSPAIVLPVALWSKDFLVAYLDQITIQNQFVHRKDIDDSILLDVIAIKLSEMELCVGTKSVSAECETRGVPLLKEKFHLDLKMERNLNWEQIKYIPGINIKGTVLAVKGVLNAEHYKIIRGILEHNIGEQIDNVVVLNSTPKPSKKSKVQMGLHNEGWTQFLVQIKLMDVTLDCVDNADCSLAIINFINSELTHRSTSFGTIEVDLVSKEIIISDTRFNNYPVNNRPNVFCNILQATERLKSTLQSKTNEKELFEEESADRYLQAELHYRATKDFKRMTVLLNHMRVIVVLDWWADVLKFVLDTIPVPDDLIKSEPVYPAASVSSGVITRHGSLLSNGDSSQLPFELRIKMTETGLVIVEDSASWDTNAIILETTAIVNYCPMSIDKPFWCTVHRLEVFSCILGLEEDTALSIVDPVINADLVVRRKSREATNGGLKELTISGEVDRFMEISVHELSIKVSYYDLRSFMRIMDSLPNQLKSVLSNNDRKVKVSEEVNLPVTANDLILASKIAKLEGMGFSHGDCFRALAHCSFDVSESAIWLTQNAIVAHKAEKEKLVTQLPEEPMQLKIHLGTVSVCLIDDCKDADIPLIEFHLRDLLVEQKSLKNEDCTLKESSGGIARGRLECDYYNRSLSGWEPLVEPFSFKSEWKKDLLEVEKQESVFLSFAVDDLVDVNLTSTFLDLYRNVKLNWTEDYYKQRDRSSSSSDLANLRRRSPFVPFALKNSTGCRLFFTTFTTEQFIKVDGDKSSLPSRVGDSWTSVEIDQVIPFMFEERLRTRHKDTRETRVHQLCVRIEGWQQVTPVSVDKVGIFFRDAKPEVIGKLSETARIVFDVTIEGNARKLITARSALVIRNVMETTAEIRLDSSKSLTSVGSKVFHLTPNENFYVPLTHINSLIYCRPYNRESSFLYCCSPIRWQHITKPMEVQEDTYFCSSMNVRQSTVNIDRSFRFCARVQRENYPPECLSYPVNFTRPAHIISLLPPISLNNRLPFDLSYGISGIQGVIPSGKRCSLHYINIIDKFKMFLQFETSSFQTFKLTQEFEVIYGCSNFAVTLEAKDNQNRSLLLQVKGVAYPGGSSMEISVGAEYWIINRTGLPLIFRQEGAAMESAGQSSDNEQARSVAPLMFSFADREAPSLCTVRIGKMVHPTGDPRWCRHFNLQKGVQFRRLYVLSRSARPDWVYSIGIDVRMGPAKYGDAHIVTLTPRFQLNNHSSHRLEFCQRYALEQKQQLADVRLSAMPKSFLPFHWSRLDQEQLLCVRISDVNGCTWSGGFYIDRIDSFHISMRDDQSRPIFLRVEVVLLGATYTVVFTDAENLPSPYLLQNCCEVPIICHQTQVTEEKLKITVRPNTIVPYAWDEPTCDPLLTCIAPGGSLASYNLNVFGECKQQLSYENFIYIAFTETFTKCNFNSINELRLSFYDSNEIGQGQLVLSVPNGTTKLILQPKVKGDRSQLWRMTSEGMLQHEGSSPPRNSRKLNSSSAVGQIWVLDIAEIALQPDKYTPLAIRKPNPQRRSTQTWEFSEDGRLRCKHHNVYVQCSDGYQGLRAGNDVVIGPLQPVIYATTNKGIPVEQAISRHRLYPGSGLVCVRVIPDGPTRVLQIFDITKKSTTANSSNSLESSLKESPEDANINLHLKIWLPVGVGISIVNRLSEECLYARLVNIMIEYTQNKTEQRFNGSIQNFQMDNQLFDAECPVFFFVTPNSGIDEQRDFHPSISFIGSRINTKRRQLIVDIFRDFQLQLKNVTLMIEERLLYKILEFIGYCGDDRWNDIDDEYHGYFKASSIVLAKRHYFGNFTLFLKQVRLSVITTNSLSQDLKLVKKATGLTLVRFEDALVELDPFIRCHICETSRFLIDSIFEHYKLELKSQAAKILGAVDFLGNPIGLVNDLSEGLSEFLNEGNVGGLLKNVTHGISNSAAKMTGTLSDGLSMVTMDERHLQNRRRIQSAHGGSSGEHMVAGFKGLGFGLYSGFTSIVTQTYEGASSEGFQGFFTGLGKGLVGTFAKPAAGVLDLATSAASAVRDTSKSKYRKTPDKLRSRRICIGLGGLLPRYSADQSRGLDILYQLNDKDYSEMLIGIEGLNYSNDGLLALMSSTKIYFISSSRECVLSVLLKDLYHCKPIQDKHQGKIMFYLELTIKGGLQPSSVTESICRPRVLCDTEAIAIKVSQKINYAKGLYEEMVNTLVTHE